MNFKALFRNIQYANKIGTSITDKAKYIGWIYRADWLKKKITLNFRFKEPIGNVKLIARNNSGSDSFIFSEVFKEECYNLNLEKFSPRIIDLGANAGFAAIYFSKIFSHATIACVEPVPDNIDILKQNIQQNNVNAEIIPAAIATENGTVDMIINDNDYGHKVNDIAFGKDFKGDHISVDTISMSSLLEKLKWDKVDLLKIDIEGYEGILFSKNISWLQYIDTIILEIHEGVSIEDIKQVCASFGLVNSRMIKGNWILSKSNVN